MNISTYVFGDFGSSYTQYPNDYAADIFQQFVEQAQATTQVAIHRRESLMYYAYIRKLEQRQYVGICAVVNGLYLQQISPLFAFFEQTIATMVERGSIVRFNEYGLLVSTTDRLYSYNEDIEWVEQTLSAWFAQQQHLLLPLPPVDFATEQGATVNFTIDDDKREIIQQSVKSGYTYIYKDRSYATARHNSYHQILAQVSQQNDALRSENDHLKEEMRRVVQQKKQMRKVVMLTLLALGLTAVLYVVYNNLSSAKSTINAQDDEIYNLNLQIQQREDKIRQLLQQHEQDRNTQQQLEQQITEQQALIQTQRMQISQQQQLLEDAGYDGENSAVEW